jgi:Domain of unknown function (DUF4288)
MMPWFAAHVVMHHQLTDGPQDRYTGYENVVLIEADTPEHAIERGAALGREDETDCSGTLTVDGRPARLVFDGVRKVVEVLHAPGCQQVAARDEITYSEFEVADADQLRRFAAGDAVPLVSIE